MSKRYYSVTDTGFVHEVGQYTQHIVISNAAGLFDAAVVNYTTEDRYTLETHEILLSKLAQRPAIDGVIFFRLAQFFYSKPPALRTLRSIIEQGYEVVFARERLAIRNLAEFDAVLPMILTSIHLDKRDERHDYFAPLLANATV